MRYAFNIVGISPVISFFNYQQENYQKASPQVGPEYIGTYRCTLDALLESIQPVPPRRGWNKDEIVDTVIHFWLNHAEQVRHWKRRLEDAGRENLLVARVGDIESLRVEFEFLLDDMG